MELINLFDLVRSLRSIVELSGDAAHVLTSRDMSDDAKEAIIRAKSLALFAKSLIFIFKLLSIAALLYAAYRLLAFFAYETAQAAIVAFHSPKLLLALTVATACYAWLRNAASKKLQ